MDIKFKETKPWLKEIEITVEPERVIKKIEEVTSSYAKTASIPGFRPGKVPRPILQRRFGATFEAMALEDLFDEIYNDIVKTYNLKPITQGKIIDYNLADDKTLKFVLSFEVIPEFELKEYRGIKVKKPELDCFDNEFERRIKYLQEKCATYRSLQRPAQNGDFILLDYEITENGKTVGEKQNGVLIELGSDKNLSEINNALIGVVANSEKQVTVTFPENYPDSSLANRTVDIKFYIRDIKERILPEIDDKFAQDLGFKDLADLRIYVNEEIKRDREAMIDEELKNQIYRYLVDIHDFEVPQSYLESAFQEIFSEYRIKDSKEAREKLFKHAQDRAKFEIIINRIAQKENLLPTEEEINQEINNLVQLGFDQSKASMLKSNPVFIMRLIRKKTLNWLVENAQIT
ncbi:MAG: trigger factor [candidate division WOR-3 bacterium]|nr:trigger factor [candidate division WOR-3 bacterium]MDW7988376.1 trigger factor [candidate division WOR-3 bacterium]